jgi:hypothetical protein
MVKPGRASFLGKPGQKKKNEEEPNPTHPKKIPSLYIHATYSSDKEGVLILTIIIEILK